MVHVRIGRDHVRPHANVHGEEGGGLLEALPAGGQGDRGVRGRRRVRSGQVRGPDLRSRGKWC